MGITATNEPKNIECGAPDFILIKGSVTVGYIEAKDIGKGLGEAEKTDQLKRYRDSLTNLILTDYIEFWWYVDGECRLKACLGSATKEGKIRRDKDGIQAVAELLTNFLSHKAEGVGTPRELARRMARQAHLIRNLIINAFQNEPEGGSLHTQLAAFRDNLIPDLSPEYFSDMYAQTIAYGLFAARCTSPDSKDFTRQNAAYLLPKTNPFLRKLFNTIAGPDLDDRIAWLVDDLAQVLAQADMEAVLKDFGKHSGKEDPVVHFYETFLKEYDEKIREMRGVYYTPEPVVSYIVRSIDHLLKTRFNKTQGLADDKTLILDPAVGTATFLYMVINEIYQANVGKGQQGLWNNYVAEKLLPRIFGFELLMAPYAVAHLKLGLLLKETGYKFHSDERLHIYLTNTLDEAFKHTETLFAQWISEEANAAAEIKKEKPIMVVLGNPPYSKASANKGEYIEKLMVRYKTAVRSERNIQPLSDDYIKFVRFAHERIERTGYGIIGMITNHSYLSGLIHRGMREELMKTFDEIYVLNLHGSALLGEGAPDGGKDENVFDIRQGVAIALFVKRAGHDGMASVKYTDLWGLRDGKYSYLLENDINKTDWQLIEPVPPYFFFVAKEFELQGEYDQFWSLMAIFGTGVPEKDRGLSWGSGVKTNRDFLLIDFDKNILENRIQMLVDTLVSDDEVKSRLGLEDGSYWDTHRERQKIRDVDWRRNITRHLYRP
ncbi:MAG: N-6 DNA methylase, partial [Chloroflexota bacterium]